MQSTSNKGRRGKYFVFEVIKKQADSSSALEQQEVDAVRCFLPHGFSMAFD